MYTVTFKDGTTFEGGNPQDSKWDQIPQKPIQSIEYSLTPFLKFLLTNFESYNHCVERVKAVGQQLDMITKVIIMGRAKHGVYQVVMDRNGGVFVLSGVKYGQEYSPSIKIKDGKFAGWDNGKPLAGWREGLMGENPKLEKYILKNNEWIKG